MKRSVILLVAFVLITKTSQSQGCIMVRNISDSVSTILLIIAFQPQTGD